MILTKLVKKVCCVTLVAASVAHASGKSSIVDKMYVRAGGGAMWLRPFNFDQLYEDKDLKVAPVYFLGVGYKYNNSIRGELDVQYGETHYKFRASGRSLTQKSKIYAAMLNGYYDFNINTRIVPYITAGIGIGQNKAGTLVDVTLPYSDDPLVTDHPGKSKTNFVWNAGAGAKFNFSKSVAIDVGYRWADFGKISTYNQYAEAKYTRSLRGHQAVVALIYSF
jgi:opacity protein-like surface antigen